MRILTLNSHYVPEIAASLYLFSNLYEDMAQQGMDVVIYTPVPTRGVSDEVRRAFSQCKIELRCDGKLTIHRFPIIGEGTSPILRALRYAVLSLMLFWKGLFARADVIFVQSTPPTLGAVAAILRIIKGVPFVYNIQDMFPESLVAAGLTTQGSLVWHVGQAFANCAHRHADKIIVISEGFRQSLLSKGVAPSKIVVAPNWVEESAVVPVPRAENKLLAKYQLDPSKIYVTHCGNIGLSQNMDLLLAVADDLRHDSNIMFLLVGNGAYRATVEQRLAEAKLPNVRLLPFQPYEDIAHVFSLGDIGLVISKAGVGESSVPSKTWSIMSAARPVLASFDLDSDLAKLLREQHCGVCVAPDDRAALRQTILDLSLDRPALNAMGARGRNYVAEYLTRSKGTSRYIKALEEVTLGGPSQHGPKVE